MYQIVKDQLDRDQSVIDLMDAMERVYSFVDEIQSVPDKINTLEKIIDSILLQTFNCAMFIQEYAGCGFTKKAFSEVFTHRATQKINEFTQKFIEMKNTLDSGIAINTAVVSSQILGKVDSTAKQETLRSLQPANMKQFARQGCLPGTRVDVVDLISAWVAHPSKDQNILWLHGLAGSGKSTLSTTVARLFRQTKRLGAFMFFDRNVSEQNNPGLVIQTLAYLLALYDHRIGDAVSAVIEKNRNIANDDVDLQFKKLLLEPLGGLVDLQLEGPIVVVLDALDECGSPKEREPLLKVLAKEFAHLPSFLRVIVTSRPDSDINCQFKSERHVLPYQLDITSKITRKDIESFFRYRMAEVRTKNPSLSLPVEWPEEQRIQALAERASGLFIWASTACKYIDAHDPEERLVTLLQADMGLDATSALDTLYTTALQFEGRSTDLAFGVDFRVIMGTLLVLRNTLSLSTLIELLAVDKTRPLEHIISQLGSVLYNNGIIRILHPSFADFLSRRDRCKCDVWFIDTTLHNIRVTRDCLDRLDDFLEENVCNLTLSREAQASLPEHIAYACVFWVEHVCLIEDTSCIADRLSAFLFKHLLHWFEAMSILKRSKDTKEMMRRLRDWHANALPGNPPLQELISDAYRFSQAFSNIIGKHPLQVYTSALPFTPVDTLLYRKFHDESRYPRIVTLKSREKSWSSRLATFTDLEIRDCYCIRFSPDSTQVMASGRFGVFLIHDVTRASSNPPIQGNFSRSCAFSPDGTWACSVHEDGFMRMWDPILESSIMEPIRIPLGGSQEARFLVASPHGTLIAYSCGRTIYVWRARSGTKIFESTPRTAQTDITCLAFSPNSNLVVSGSENGDIFSWDLSSGGEILGQSLDCTARVLSVHITFDGSQILSVGNDWFVRVWNVTLGTCKLATPLQVHNGVAQLAAFSADGQQIVLSTRDGTIGLWSSSSGVQIHIITTNLSAIVDLALSPNGRVVASASERSVSLWDATIPANLTVNLSHRQWHAPWIKNGPCITYSSDGTLLAFSATENKQPNPIILILNGKTGIEKYKPLRGHKGSNIRSIAFSPDSLRIASCSNDGIRVWDATLGVRVSAFTEALASSIQTLAFSPDGCRLVSGARDGGAIYVWEASSGTAILGPLHGYGLRPQSESIDSVSFSPDGGRIISASGHGIIHVWDAESGATILSPFRGCANDRSVWPRVAFSIDGTRIMIQTKHADFKQWDAITGDCIATRPTNVHPCGAIDRFTFCRPSGWIIDLTTGFYLSYPTVPLISGMCSSSSQTSVAFATSNNIYIIHYPPRMLSL
ncbi:hypothetical protein PILCRDRAFT_474447 [Piloderma croceum F 1598]|uniref:NACHT domain-containing protein n=1 Tax=Piloderma croceum (strain F 1598) TaxID=765440 RepID=A0A0C3FRC5_PILCF|nr:hypothetical protein PILCRDRAFT_474447 [Piloderma croceum F 1598]